MTTRSIAFDRIVDRYEETRGGLDRGRRFAKTLGRYTDPLRPVVELGCGTGAISLPLAELGHTVVGLDLSRPMLEVAAGRLPGRLIESDASWLPIRTGAAGTVVAVWLVHLVGDPDGLAAEVTRILGPGGQFLVLASVAEEEADDMTAILAPLGRALGRARDRSDVLAPWLASFGLDHELDTPTDDYVFEETPAERADKLDQRVYSMLWDLDDGVWTEVVAPAVVALRALPEPHRPRRRVHRHILSVYRR